MTRSKTALSLGFAALMGLTLPGGLSADQAGVPNENASDKAVGNPHPVPTKVGTPGRDRASQVNKGQQGARMRAAHRKAVTPAVHPSPPAGTPGLDRAGQVNKGQRGESVRETQAQDDDRAVSPTRPARREGGPGRKR